VFFRPPYGASNSTTVTLARNHGMSVVTWSEDTPDLGNAPVSQHHVPKHDCFQSDEPAELHPDILMHDGSPANYRQNTLNSVQRIITFYKSRGYMCTNSAGR
jgi:peptidoglycan/xylan/chitin deacetylase (PgdA/CDA1 family)